MKIKEKNICMNVFLSSRGLVSRYIYLVMVVTIFCYKKKKKRENFEHLYINPIISDTVNIQYLILTPIYSSIPPQYI